MKTKFPGPADRLLLFRVAVLTAVLAVALYTFAAITLAQFGALTLRSGWSAEARNGRFYVDAVDPNGPAAGILRPGDALLSLDGDGRVATAGPVAKWRSLSTAVPYRIEVARGADRYEYLLKLELQRSGQRAAINFSYFLISGAWLGLAILVALLKPDQPISRLALAAGATQGLILLRIAVGSSAIFLSGWARAIAILIFPLTPLQLAVGYHFYYRFPPGVPAGRFWSWVAVALYAWTATLILTLRVPVTVAALASEDRALQIWSSFGPLFDRLAIIDMLFYPVAGLAMAAVIARNYRRVDQPDQGRRLKWLVWGSVVGLGPFIIIQVAGVLRVAMGHPFISPVWIVVGNLATVAIPLSFGYAILKHRVFDITVVVRRGFQYLLAKNALRVLLSLPIVGLAYTMVVNRHLTVTEALFRNPAYLYLLVAAALSLRYRAQLREWVDRQFFREAYNRDRILLGLLDDLDKLESGSEASHLVSRELESAFHPSAIYMWYRQRQESRLALTYSSGPNPASLEIPEHFKLVQLMDAQTSAIELPLSDDRLPEAEERWLEALGVQLVVPVTGTDQRMLGLLMVGPKRSEEPYTASDRRFLQAIARQIGVLRENAELKVRVDHDRRIRHTVLARLDDQQFNVLKECPSCGACFDSSASVCAVDGAELTLSLPVERTIDGKYRLERLIGRGGMGAVYEATDLRLGRRIAVKIMLGRIFGDTAALRRFEREARAVARLNHPNIVAVYDYGGIGAEGAYLVMELVPGIPLRGELTRLGLLTPALAADWFSQILDGVKAAHQQHVIHRDLKPENILIAQRPTSAALIKILDFGLAKVRTLETEDTTVTMPGVRLGTAAYMAPEQLVGKEVDERADIFSLGVMVVEALTGSRPFGGRTPDEILLSIVTGPFRLPGDSAAARHLDAVLQKCLAKSPDDRFASIEVMQDELIAAIREGPSFYPAQAVGPGGETVTS